MRFIVAALLLVGTSLNAVAESVHDRLLAQAMRANDTVKAAELIKSGASSESYFANQGNTNIWIQDKKPSPEMITLFYKNGLKMKHDGQCVIADVLNSKLDMDVTRVVAALIDNGEDLSCHALRQDFVSGQMIESNLLTRVVGQRRSYPPLIESLRILLKSPASNLLNKYVRQKHGLEVKPISFAEDDFIIRVLIEQGTDLNEPISRSLNDKNAQKQYLLQFLAARSHVMILKDVLEKVSDINVVDAQGMTVLDVVHERKNDELELYLLNKGAKYAKYSKLNKP